MGIEREISIEFRVSPEHDLLSKLAPLLNDVPNPRFSLGRVSGLHDIETSSSPKLRKTCMQRKNGRLRPQEP